MKPKKKIYFFSVEGQTEKEYLLWLEREININIRDNSQIKFDIKVNETPLKRIKSLPKNEINEVFHFCDYESCDKFHQQEFEKTIDQLVKAKEASFIKDYNLCYSNYTFDLWLILHKKSLFSSISHRKNYISYINSIFKTDYRGMHEFKKKENLRKILKSFSLEDVKEAIQREKEIYQHNKLNGYPEIKYKGYLYFRENPSLNVGSCIEKILRETGLINE